MFRFNKPSGWRGAPRRGIAIITVLLILVLLAGMTFLLTQLSATDYADAKSVVDATTTLYLADAGIEYALLEIKHNLPILTEGIEQVVVDEFNYSATNNWIANEGGTPAVGTFEINLVRVYDDNGRRILVIKSIGRIRQKPDPTVEASPDPTDTTATNLYYNGDGTTAHKGLRNWTPILAQRTVNANISFATAASPQAGNAFKVDYWYEPYR